MKITAEAMVSWGIDMVVCGLFCVILLFFIPLPPTVRCEVLYGFVGVALLGALTSCVGLVKKRAKKKKRG